MKFYKLTLRVTPKTATEPKLDEPDLLYLASKFGGEFQQFVKGDLEKPRDWWHTRMNWLTWMTTEMDDDGKLKLPLKLCRQANRLSIRIEAMLAGEPSRVEAETATEPDVPAGTQLALF